MSKKVERNYLEINSMSELNETEINSQNFKIKLVKPADFQINKFFYKNVGKNHQWVDRLVWTEKQWIDYACDQKVKTYILKYEKDLAGYFELISHKDKNEVEIAYLGLLEEYLNKKLGSYLLTSAIKYSFLGKP
ncbi:GNAT family N-acetyltransferase, partial [Candidatus Pelagibacter sp.]|nr:GNAT family N-acetyltransferase [Candidatus Pelagibacter sp.]MDC3207989.1 GNAT family N-acetyltransferase [Candidatus Pelagibacter sp.]